MTDTPQRRESDSRGVPAKPRSQIVRETVTGYTMAVGGGFILWRVVEGGGSTVMTLVAAGLIAFGMFMANKKLSTEYLIQLKEVLAFWKK